MLLRRTSPRGSAAVPRTIRSWSNILPAETRLVSGSSGWREAIAGEGPVIPRGAGRSHGNCAYVAGGFSCTSEELGDLLEIDESGSSIAVGAGVRVGDLHRYLRSTPFEFPVFGGTQWATVGGAVAGDIHGKNHPAGGSFGNHVRELTVLTAEGERVVCGPARHPDLFAATVGGIGLTGLIESARLELAPARSRTLREEREVVAGFGPMFDRWEELDEEFSQVVWVDLSSPRALGVFCVGSRVDARCRTPRRTLSMPLPRVRMIRPGTVRAATAMLSPTYSRSRGCFVDITDYNYSGPHERCFHWNKLYGGVGAIEFQFALGEPAFREALAKLVTQARRLSISLHSSVIKRLGSIAPVGMLSFPIPGYTLTTQTPYSRSAIDFLRDFTGEVVTAGGRVNLTKDACTTPEDFSAMYPRRAEEWQRVVKRYDPANRIASDMSRRLAMKPW